MTARSRSWLAWCLSMAMLLVGFLAGGRASAEVRVVPPGGWSAGADADAESRQRASKWAQSAGMQVVQIASSNNEDEFVETVVVLERNEPLAQAAATDADVAMDRLSSDLSALLGAEAPEPETSGFRPVEGGEVFHARWAINGAYHDTMLVPSGSTYSVVLTTFSGEDAILYAAMIEEVLDSVTGLEAAIEPFDGAPWRWGPWITWIVLAFGLHLLMLRFTDRAGDHRTASRRAATVLAICAVVAAALSFLTLSGRADAIAVAESSVGSIVGEIFLGGIMFAALLIGVGTLLDRGERIQSAPQASTHETFRRMEPTAGLEPVSHGTSESAVPGHVEPSDDERGRAPGDA